MAKLCHEGRRLLSGLGCACQQYGFNFGGIALFDDVRFPNRRRSRRSRRNGRSRRGVLRRAQAGGSEGAAEAVNSLLLLPLVLIVLADQLGRERQKAFLKKMGFLDPIRIELKEKGRTLTPGNRWGPFETMTVGFGHAVAVTPLHLATGYATLFNGGVYRPATILKVGPGHPAGKGHRVFSEDTSYRMRALLRLVVTQGTGKRADAPGYRVGGKTGTAEKLVGGHYSKTAVVTSFAGVFPMDEPRYVIVVMLDEPKASKATFGYATAGWVAMTTEPSAIRLATAAAIVRSIVSIVAFISLARFICGRIIRKYMMPMISMVGTIRLFSMSNAPGAA